MPHLWPSLLKVSHLHKKKSPVLGASQEEKWVLSFLPSTLERWSRERKEHKSVWETPKNLSLGHWARLSIWPFLSDQLSQWHITNPMEMLESQQAISDPSNFSILKRKKGSLKSFRIVASNITALTKYKPNRVEVCSPALQGVLTTVTWRD